MGFQPAMASPQRIVVIGSTGSGKTTLSQNLSGQLGLARIELDAIHWGADWTARDPGDIHTQTEAAIRVDRWVVDGNWKVVFDLVLKKADTVVWLNYPLPLVLWRLFRRTVRRAIRQEELWNGNVENWKEHFLSRNSIFLYAIRHTYRFRKTYRDRFNDPAYSHLQMIELRSPRQTWQWLNSLGTENAL
jgi:adenylate kinase family enzyme